ncbi:Cryptochrome [Croceitalea dokdonensis DOKDO 023]|uniref:Cryptochrome DASH n=1 Tax=Croceitalea dokdonensis DOKDO 023 TaxID=1300341 RepID=A0A0P7AZC1_9FLAO|nr:DASH family cryptochrome [Croceitalea dokdonensis]KPM31874.1 Cryptochrome [Croceitalea dokdonensis DOKDO 023]
MGNLIWFQNNLRIKDNYSLAAACTGERVIAVYFFDPRQFAVGTYGFKKTGKYRAKFLIESVQNLKDNLAKLQIDLLVFHDRPEHILPKLLEKHHLHKVFLQKEWTRDEVNVLKATKAMCDAKVTFLQSYEQLLFHPEDTPFSSFGQTPDVFTAFRKKCEKYGSVKKEVAVPQARPSENRITNNTTVPTLKALGFDDLKIDKRSAFPFTGGEDEALSRLQDYFWNTQKLSTYKKTRNGLVGTGYSSKFSPWLANGCISPRTIYWQIRQYEQQIKKNQDTYWLIFELIWRDYFKYVSLKYGDKIFHLGGILDREYEWNRDLDLLEQWTLGKTPEPFINANMQELLHTGWMSNRGRQNVASYWAKELEQDWRMGASYFESLLVDYDVHSNWCNWMYLSGVGNDPRDRKFNIKRQAEMYDANQTFQHLWLT